MADIFISYSHQDRIVAQKIASAFESFGWSVFWARSIKPGERFDDVMENELKNCRCQVVLWSETSVESSWVRGEGELWYES